MSRIGKKPIEVPTGVTVDVSAGGRVMVHGPLGQLEQQVPQRMKIEQGEGQVSSAARPTAATTVPCTG